MSQLGNREPGLVGAALAHGDVFAGLIADGIHVHPAAMRTAFSAKTGTDRIFLVSDAMATAGSAITEFQLNNRRILRRDGRLTLADGTLAGADLDIPRALSVLVKDVGLTLADAVPKATTIPTSILRHDMGFGRLGDRKGHLILLDKSMARTCPLSRP